MIHETMRTVRRRLDAGCGSAGPAAAAVASVIGVSVRSLATQRQLGEAHSGRSYTEALAGL